jgi:hypothetical protein
MADSPFAHVDGDRAYDAIDLVWGDLYNVTWVEGTGWSAEPISDPRMRIVRATPAELNEAIRADWLSRQRTPVPAQHGPSGMGPS